MDNTDNTKVRKIATNERVDPTFVEGDVFKTIIPLSAKTNDHVSDQVGDQVGDEYDRTREILVFCKTPRSRSEIQEFVKITSKRYLRQNILNPLLKGGLLKQTIPDKPTSPKQKYYSIYKKL